MDYLCIIQQLTGVNYSYRASKNFIIFRASFMRVFFLGWPTADENISLPIEMLRGFDERISDHINRCLLATRQNLYII